MWPILIDMGRSAAKPSLTLPGIAAMLEARQTPAFHAMAPRPLSEHEAVIRAWLAKAEEQRRTDLGDALDAVPCNIERHGRGQPR